VIHSGVPILQANRGIIAIEVDAVNRREWTQRSQQWQGFEGWENNYRSEGDVSVRLRQVGEMMDFWRGLREDEDHFHEAVSTTGQNIRRMHERLKGTIDRDRP
jgi:hypothetical protein